MCFIREKAPDLESGTQPAWKVYAFLCSLLRGCWRVRVAIAILNNFKQLILPTQLNGVCRGEESEIILSIAKLNSTAFIKCFLVSHWLFHRPSKYCSRVTHCLVQQHSETGTLKWSDDSWVLQHKMIEASVKDQVWQKDNLRVMLCPFRRDKDWDFDSLFAVRHHCKLHVIGGWKKKKSNK